MDLRYKQVLSQERKILEKDLRKIAVYMKHFIVQAISWFL